MAKPYIHALSSARSFGGSADDYIDIHTFMDSSKAAMSDNRHRALTHHAWFIQNILPLKFGAVRINSAGRTYSVTDIGEQHVKEDFGGVIPTAQDYLQEIEPRPWMSNGRGKPPSARKLNIPGKENDPVPNEEPTPGRSVEETSQIINR